MSDLKHSERRKSKRFDTRLDIEYRTLTQNPLYGNVTSEDISKGGICLPAGTDIKKGTSIELKMNVPGDNLPVFATGTVAWADGVRTGIKLTKIGKGDQARILEFIYKEWLKSREHVKNSNEALKESL
jgi:c-di-GMP-binding flagellar brake protein YcgR